MDKNKLKGWIPLDEQKPENGQNVLLLVIHWKEHFPLSYEIKGMEYEVHIEEDGENFSRFTNSDFRGQGLESETIRELDGGCTVYWLPEEKAVEFLPVHSDPHWKTASYIKPENNLHQKLDTEAIKTLVWEEFPKFLDKMSERCFEIKGVEDLVEDE